MCVCVCVCVCVIKIYSLIVGCSLQNTIHYIALQTVHNAPCILHCCYLMLVTYRPKHVAVLTKQTLCLNFVLNCLSNFRV